MRNRYPWRIRDEILTAAISRLLNQLLARHHGSGPLPRLVRSRSVTIVVCAALFLGSQRATLAALSCGAEPAVAPADVASQFTSDAKDKAALITRALQSVNLRNFVMAQRLELRQKYPNVDQPTRDSYLLWATCRTISNDDALAGSQMFDEYSILYRLLSEPIRTGAPAE